MNEIEMNAVYSISVNNQYVFLSYGYDLTDSIKEIQLSLPVTSITIEKI